jgi:hypothetical protein
MLTEMNHTSISILHRKHHHRKHALGAVRLRTFQSPNQKEVELPAYIPPLPHADA